MFVKLANQSPVFFRFRVVALDLKGFADSDKPSWSSNYRDDVIVEEIKSLVDVLHGDDQKIVLLGHGLGGKLGWRLAEKYPDLIDKLILISAPHPHHWLQHISSSLRNIVDHHCYYSCRLPYLAENKLSRNQRKLFDKRFKSWSNIEAGEDLITLKVTVKNISGLRQSKLFQEAYNYTFSEASDWTGPVNYYRNLDLAQDFSQMNDDIKHLAVETLLIIGNDDRDVALDLITSSAEIPEK